jgi:ATP-dependent protease ClpP protease subunit
MFALMKLKYTQYADSDEPIMLINKHIGMDAEDGEGIMGAQFQTELMYLDTLGKKRIKVFVLSPGGSVMDGMMIYNAILTTKTKVDTYNMGVAASIAGVICQAGRTRYVMDYALSMMHNPFDPTSLGATPELQSFKDSIVKMLARKNPSKTEEQISDYMNNTTWMNAEIAKEAGFYDVIEVSSDMNKPRAVSTITDAKATWKQYANYYNSINKNQTPTTNMKNVFNKLKITENSSEEVMVKAIEAIENRATTAEIEKNKVVGELEKAKTDLAALQNKVTDLEAAAQVVKEKEDAEKAKALNDAADLLIENAAKVGKIKNDVDTIKNMKAQAVQNFDGTKAVIDAMPLNTKGANIANTLAKDVKPYNMVSAMAEIRNKASVK